MPFKNIRDAEDFIATGDVSKIASEIKFKGQPMQPETLAAIKKSQAEYDKRYEPLQKLRDEIELKRAEQYKTSISTPDYAKAKKEADELYKQYANKEVDIRLEAPRPPVEQPVIRKTRGETFGAVSEVSKVKPSPVKPEVAKRTFIGVTKSAEPTQARAPWRVAYKYKGEEHAGYFS